MMYNYRTPTELLTRFDAHAFNMHTCVVFKENKCYTIYIFLKTSQMLPEFQGNGQDNFPHTILHILLVANSKKNCSRAGNNGREQEAFRHTTHLSMALTSPRYDKGTK